MSRNEKGILLVLTRIVFMRTNWFCQVCNCVGRLQNYCTVFLEHNPTLALRFNNADMQTAQLCVSAKGSKTWPLIRLPSVVYLPVTCHRWPKQVEDLSGHYLQVVNADSCKHGFLHFRTTERGTASDVEQL